jgi:hypothetical protein
MTICINNDLQKKFVAPALPVPPLEYDQRYATDLIRVLRLYFNQIDNFQNAVAGILNGTACEGDMTPLPISIGGTNVDAFNRLRVSNPLTLFDSSHRYADNNLWASSITGTAAATFSADEGLVNLTVGTANGDQIIRETTKVFAYQPGKSLLVMNTFVMGTAKANLRQRVGYYGVANGMYFERDGTSLYFVERSSVTGSVVNTRVAQQDWNQDTLDGSGSVSNPSGLTLDASKAQILYMDVEWLGLGTVRMGFIINGVFIPAHNFNHANIITTTYITTASLPLRYEMTNTAATASASTFKQVCSTVISEGGYELRGAQLSIGNTITSPRTLTTAGTFYPVVSIRLKTTRLDAIVILTALSILGITNNANYKWEVVASGSTTGGTWVSAGTNSAVEYNITGTAFSSTGGRILATGFFQGSNQGSNSVDILKEALFASQLEREPFTATPYELTLACTAAANGNQVLGSVDWEEISR